MHDQRSGDSGRADSADLDVERVVGPGRAGDGHLPPFASMAGQFEGEVLPGLVRVRGVGLDPQNGEVPKHALMLDDLAAP
jgi:hypothetical protein